MKKNSHRYVRKTAAGVVALSMLCAAAIPSVLAMSAGAASASGDLNGDGSVTAADAAMPSPQNSTPTPMSPVTALWMVWI